MSEFQASNFKKQNGGAPDLVGKTEFSSHNYFVPPSGNTASRPQNCAPGTIRFNTDFSALEIFRGDTIGWHQLRRRPNQYLGGHSGQSAGSATGVGVRAFFGGGQTPSLSDVIDFVTISTLGDALDFGNLSAGKQRMAPVANSIRGILAGGFTTNFENEIEFFTFASTQNASDFGDLTRSNNRLAAVSNQTRGCFGGGNPESDVIDYITIAQTGNAVDFGNLTNSRQSLRGLASTTRGLFVAGLDGSSPYTSLNTVDFITISTTGNATDFGDINRLSQTGGACSNATRGLYTGGYTSTPTPAAGINTIEFCTIATLGNFIDFGDATSGVRNNAAAASPTRAITSAGGDTPSNTNTIDYVQIATTGNASDFGDLSVTRTSVEGHSNGHGGL